MDDRELAEHLQQQEVLDVSARQSAQYQQILRLSTTGQPASDLTTSDPLIEQDSIARDAQLASTLQLAEFSSPTTPTETKAYKSATATFPNGFDIIPTPVDELRCGIYAIILSYSHQFPDLTDVPDYDELMSIIATAAFRNVMGLASVAPECLDTEDGAYVTGAEEAAHEALTNDRYFSPDQLDILLSLWGWRRGLNLRLGYIEENTPKLLARQGADDKAEVVWIHFDGTGMGHYSGVNPREGHYGELMDEGW